MTYSKIFIFSFFLIISSILFLQYAEGTELRHFIKKELTCGVTPNESITTVISLQNGTDFNMIANKQYLLIAEGKFGGASTSKPISMEVQHNGTQFEGSFLKIEVNSLSDDCSDAQMYNYLWFTVYNATGNENLTIVLQAFGGGNKIVHDDFKLALIELDVEFVEDTDWFFDVNFVDSPLGSNFNTTNSAKITITPENDSIWLVFGTAELDTGTATASFQSRALISTSAGNQTNVLLSQEGEDPNDDNFVQTFSAFVGLNATETSIEIQSQIDPISNGTNQRLSNAIFALNTELFQTTNSTFIVDPVLLLNGTTFSQEVTTINITPEIEGDFFIYGGIVKEGINQMNMRLQTDNVDTPANQTLDEYPINLGWSTIDQLQTSIFDIVNLNTTITHSLDVDANSLIAISTITDQSLYAFSFEITIPRFQTDTMIINDTNSFNIDFAQSQTDTLIINDTNSFIVDVIQNQSDTMIINDTNSFIVDFAQNQSDTMIINDTNSFIVDFAQSQSDIMIINDTNSFTIDFAQSQSDTMIINDTNSFIVDVIQSQSDTMIINDTNSFIVDVIQNQSDTMIINDTNSFTIDFAQSQSDTMIINDTNSFTINFAQNQTDTLIINDTNSFIVMITRNQTDTMIINDTNTFIVDVIQNQSDTMIINDTNSFTINFAQNQTDTMILNDTNTFLVMITRNQTDTMIINDTNTFIADFIRNQSDTMIINDTNTFIADFIRNQADSMIINDTNSFFISRVNDQADSIIINDTNSFFISRVNDQADSMVINDTNSFIADFIRNQADSMIINDTNSFIVDIIQNISPVDNTITFVDGATFFFDVFVEPPPPVIIAGGGVGTVGGVLPPTIPDSDGDGILDPEDACPLEPEDFDGFEDADGCPEDGFVQPPQPLSIPDIVDLIPFEFNELDVIDDFIDLEEDLPQPQVADLGVRWLGAEPITITSIDIGLSPFEIQVQDIPITFGNNRFGYTETQLLYTVQPPDKICGNIITTDCLDEVTYKIPVVVTGVINGKTVIADGSITIDNSSRINPYWLAFFALILIPLLAIMFWKKRSTKVTTKQKLKLTQRPNTSRTLTVTKSKPLKSGTTRKLLTESKKTNILGKKTK